MVGALSLFPLQEAHAQFVGVEVADPDPNYQPPRADEPPTEQRRTELCIEEWHKSYAHTEQRCKVNTIRWDSYWFSPSYFYYDTSEGTHMKYSNCSVKVKCTSGRKAIGVAKYNSTIRYEEVNRLRRCEDPGTELNTHCDPLTPEELRAAINEYFDTLNQPQGSSNQPTYRSSSSGNDAGMRN